MLKNKNKQKQIALITFFVYHIFLIPVVVVGFKKKTGTQQTGFGGARDRTNVSRSLLHIFFFF